jgi:hypothetical protein
MGRANSVGLLFLETRRAEKRFGTSPRANLTSSSFFWHLQPATVQRRTDFCETQVEMYLLSLIITLLLF